MSPENAEFDAAEIAAIKKRARTVWVSEQLPRLLFTIHLMVFAFSSFVILAMSQQLFDVLDFPPGLIILGWMGFIILHWGGTAIWSSYTKAMSREFDLYRSLLEKRKHTEIKAATRLSVGDDGELVEFVDDEPYPARQTKAKR